VYTGAGANPSSCKVCGAVAGGAGGGGCGAASIAGERRGADAGMMRAALVCGGGSIASAGAGAAPSAKACTSGAGAGAGPVAADDERFGAGSAPGAGVPIAC